MNTETNIQNPKLKSSDSNQRHFNKLKIIAAVLTFLGIGLFGYLIYSVGAGEILSGIEKIGFAGFAAIIVIYFFRILFRIISLIFPRRLEFLTKVNNNGR